MWHRRSILGGALLYLALYSPIPYDVQQVLVVNMHRLTLCNTVPRLHLITSSPTRCSSLKIKQTMCQ